MAVLLPDTAYHVLAVAVQVELWWVGCQSHYQLPRTTYSLW